jgi:pyruvate formate lyase activating enzyme
LSTLRVHSIFAPACSDGPGVRAVVFTQGCGLRCAYCHNRDTWAQEGGTVYDTDALAKKLARFTPYFGKCGGVTVSGGEPLLQGEGVTALFRTLKQKGVHTALDTAGGVNADFSELFAVTDLVLLDIKHTDGDAYRALTGGTLSVTLDFLDKALQAGREVVVRQVIIPGINDTAAQVQALKKAARGCAVELKPYHTMGLRKWEMLGVRSPLAQTPPTDEAGLAELRELLL